VFGSGESGKRSLSLPRRYKAASLMRVLTSGRARRRRQRRYMHIGIGKPSRHGWRTTAPRRSGPFPRCASQCAINRARNKYRIQLQSTPAPWTTAPLRGRRWANELPRHRAAARCGQNAWRRCQINLSGSKGARSRMRDHTAATAFRHSLAASARKIRSVDRETRWR
jgi:hypothetical protein